MNLRLDEFLAFNLQAMAAGPAQDPSMWSEGPAVLAEDVSLATLAKKLATLTP